MNDASSDFTKLGYKEEKTMQLSHMCLILDMGSGLQLGYKYAVHKNIVT